MRTSDLGDEEAEVEAAGGLVSRETPAGLEVAVIHRPRYEDWSLPKGKLQPNEPWEEAALREVEEETGLRCELGEELAPSRYRDRKGRSKLVRWWSMRALDGDFEPNDEVDELRWVSVADAAELLDHEQDRALVRTLGQPST